MSDCKHHIYDEYGLCFECDKKKPTRGGKRNGAGRPSGTTKKNKKVPYSIKIDPQLLEKLRAHDLPASRIIDRAVRDWLKKSTEES